MHRRDFLTTAAKMSSVVAIMTMFPRVGQAHARTHQFKGTSQGQILESPDGGRNWQMNLNLGPECRVLSVIQTHDQVIATIAFHGHRFRLYRVDSQKWRTMA